MQDALSTTVLAAMILFAIIVDVTIFLVLLRCTLWTRVSDDQISPLASLVWGGDSDQPYQGMVGRALPYNTTFLTAVKRA